MALLRTSINNCTLDKSLRSCVKQITWNHHRTWTSFTKFPQVSSKKPALYRAQLFLYSAMAAPQVARRACPGTAAALKPGSKVGSHLGVVEKDSALIQRRLEIFEELHAEQQKRQSKLPRFPIVITLPDGSTREGVANDTTPFEIATAISKGLAQHIVIASVLYDDERMVRSKIADCEAIGNDEGCCGTGDDDSHSGAEELWDLNRPLTGNCRLEFLKFEDSRAQTVFWHSSAHVLGECLEQLYGAHLTVGPPLERGFYYDAYYGENRVISEQNYAQIEEVATQISKEDQPFIRLELTKEEALRLFADNPFKQALIRSKVPDGGMSSCYRCGPLVDLCRGPHVPSTGKIRAFALEKSSAVYWLGDAANGDRLQRVYGISFPDAKLLKQYQTMVEEAKKRDHRAVGNQLSLYFFEPNLSPGCCFWLPDGARIYNKLTQFIRNEYRIRGFTEVISPNIYNCDLFKISGHLQNYKENMYCFDVEGQEWALKPMNCPGHCLMFRHIRPSYRQLPIRMADFGVLHRNEASGSLTGLLRVRRFQQDDAHIFCRMDQVRDEVIGALEFLFYVYGVLGFDFELALSTRPKKALGSIDLWRDAETALKAALDETKRPWKLNPGDGAFYGPKIDIRVRDALQRWHQCGTVQLDFQLPLRFDLQYRTADEARKDDTSAVADGSSTAIEDGRGEVTEAALSPIKNVDGSLESPLKPGHARPVMVHRAILGSLERVAAVLVEHTGGKFPFWLSPRQVLVVPISEKQLEYAEHVARILRSKGYDVGVDESNATINKKIRQGQLERWCYIAVVGAQEQENGTVTLRDRDDVKNQRQLSLREMVDFLVTLEMPSSVKSDDEIPPFRPTA